jgi:hypothetical protein
MTFVSGDERVLLQAVSKLGYCNPFLPERIIYEREALGGDFVEGEAVWSLRVDDPSTPRANNTTLAERVANLVEKLCERLRNGIHATTHDLGLYEDAVLFLLFHRTQVHFYSLIMQSQQQRSVAKRLGLYTEFFRDWEHFFTIPRVTLPGAYDAPHLFACFFQVRRAFHHIIESIIGSSLAAARLRASVWQSIFTHDMRRYRRTLYDRMGDFTTLICGPSGTGKELVARAIGLSRYVPFDVN